MFTHVDKCTDKRYGKEPYKEYVWSDIFYNVRGAGAESYRYHKQWKHM